MERTKPPEEQGKSSNPNFVAAGSAGWYGRRNKLERDYLNDPDGLEREFCSRRLRNFVYRAWPVLEPKTEFSRGAQWYVDAICEHLEALVRSQIRNLLINIPGRMGKSLSSVVFLPAWAWTWAAHTRFIFASYSTYLSRRDSRKTRTLILSDWYQRLWGDKFQLSEDQNQVDRFDNTATGFRIATSVGGMGTGEGGHIVAVDDPHNVLQAESDTQRNEAIRWWDETMGDRLDDPKTGGRLITAHRVHARDLSAHVLEKGGYVHLMLPMEYDPKRTCYTEVRPKDAPKDVNDLYRWDPRTEEGELMDPSRVGPKEVEQIKKNLGSYAWPARLQQRPSLREGAMINLNWFKRFETPPSTHVQIIQSWDTANKEGQQKAYSVCGTFLRTETGHYLVHVFRRRMNIPQLKRTVISLAHTPWGRVHALLIENQASGIGLIQHLQEETDLPVIACQPVNDKITRMDIETPAIEAGKLWLPQSAEWLPDFETEIRDFPGSAYMDQADMLSQYLAWSRDRKEVMGESWSIEGIMIKQYDGTLMINTDVDEIVYDGGLT